jgi:SAM-dependent methyltransferase
MRADYSIKSDPSLSEEDRLDNHWTENWKKIDNQRRSQWRIKLRPEYKVVRKYAPQPGNGVRVLDGGCGLGEWCILLKDLGYEPYGLDLSTPTVQALREEFPDMYFVREDIRKTSFEDNFFDLYISWGTFEHFENGLQDCFKEAHRVLKPNGTLIISVPFYNSRLKTLDAENVISDNEPSQAEKKNFTNGDWKEASSGMNLKSTGFPHNILNRSIPAKALIVTCTTSMACPMAD